MKYIDLESWKRKEHFEFFYRADYPQYNLCANVDITRLLDFVHKESLPFYYTMIHTVSKVANEFECFRYRIREGKVVLHEVVHPSFTDMDPAPDDDLFKMITATMDDDLKSFIQKSRKISENQKKYFDFEKMQDRDDFLYITCIPWVSFTSMTHTVTLNRDDSVPRLSWGKYFREGNKVLLPFSVQVHHSLVDGGHVGQYFLRLQEVLDTF